MKSFHIAVLLCALGITQATAQTVSPAGIAADIKKTGAAATIDDLVANYEFDGVLDNIAGGDKNWIALAPKFAPGTDEMTAMQLGIALATALPKNPAAVLAATSDKPVRLTIESVCALPFTDDATQQAREQYKQQAITAVQALKTPAADRCLKALTAWQYKAPAP